MSATTTTTWRLPIARERAPETTQRADVRHWQSILIALGVAMVVLTALLQVGAMFLTSTVTEDKTVTGKIITTTQGAAVPGSLVTACLGGAVLLLVGAFYGRITKLSWAGVVVDLGAPAEKAVEDKANDVARTANKPDLAEHLTRRSKQIAKIGNLATTLSPDALAEFSVNAAARELKIL